jgi:hypothetical protein
MRKRLEIQKKENELETKKKSRMKLEKEIKKAVQQISDLNA